MLVLVLVSNSDSKTARSQASLRRGASRQNLKSPILRAADICNISYISSNNPIHYYEDLYKYFGNMLPHFLFYPGG